MIVLDLLFNIHFAPFQKYPERGRVVATFLLSQFLTLIFCGMSCIVLNWLFDLRLIRTISPEISGILSVLFYFIFFLFLNKVYIVDQRNTDRFMVCELFGLLIPILTIFAVLFFGYAVYKFG